MSRLRRALVVGVAKVDEALDEVLYRPAVVKAFGWLPRWWLCDLAKASMWLDDRWTTGYWEGATVPGGPCEACGRRAAIHVYGGRDLDDDEDPADEVFFDNRLVHTCGWCHLRGPVNSEEELRRELAAARRASISWRWRWPPR